MDRAAHYKTDQAPAIAKVDELADCDAIILGCGARYGRISSRFANFPDQTGGLWARGALNGRVGSAASQHGGQETILIGLITNMMHWAW